jgi:hypothetical protein
MKWQKSVKKEFAIVPDNRESEKTCKGEAWNRSGYGLNFAGPS